MKAGTALFNAVIRHLIAIFTAKPFSFAREQIGGLKDDGVSKPQIYIEESESRFWQSATFDGETHRFIICVEGGARQDQMAVRVMADEVIKAFEGVDLSMGGHVLIDLVFTKVFYEKADEGRSRARLFFTAVTVVD